MGRAKEQFIKEQERGNHLDCCMKCGTVLRGYEERNAGVCDNCFQRAIEKD